MSIKRIHLIGVCGIAMGTFALMLVEKGYLVSGSDQDMYPPMSNMLKSSNVDLREGFNSSNILDADLIIVGNAISRGNVEVEALLNKKIPYLSMSVGLYNFFLNDKEIISISGTHGKTTTTGLLSHILSTAGEDPSFFIGGYLKKYNSNYRLGNGKYFVIEGDEYDSAFFEKIPKFISYKPHHLILTSLEFDHADIYSNLEEIELWFKRLINLIPSQGNIIYSREYKNLHNLISNSFSNNFSYGSDNADMTYRVNTASEKIILKLNSSEYKNIEMETSLLGKFNYDNITAALSMALKLGIDRDAIYEGVKTFPGIKRRQDLIYKSENILIYEDFAHHPTAIKYIIDTMKNSFPDKKLWAIYEPRSATSRRNVFEDKLPNAFLQADKILIKRPSNFKNITSTERLDVDKIKQELLRSGADINIFDKTNNIVKSIIDNINVKEKNIILIMSNGGFDNIYGKLIDAVEKLESIIV